eukprot:COSAG06_NODE_21545_length_753_cov_1.500000_1_plen_60_part_10
MQGASPVFANISMQQVSARELQPNFTERINELYYASVDTTPRVQKTLSLIYPNLKSQLGD